MPTYICDHCVFSSKLKGDFRRHLNSIKHKNAVIEYDKQSQKDPEKTPKDPTKTQKDPVKYNFDCLHCDAKFSTFAHKRRHELHRCKNAPYSEKKHNKEMMEVSVLVATINNEKNENAVKLLKVEKEQKKVEKEKNKLLLKMEKEKKKLEKQIEKLLDKVGNVTTNTNTNSNNNITNNIIVNNYGKENMDYITDEYLSKLLQIPYDAIQHLIKNVHFHPKHPENHNLKITNKKLPYAMVWNDTIWETRDKKEVIGDLVDKSYNIIDNHNDVLPCNSDESNNSYNKFQKFYDNTNDTKDNIEKDTELLVINESKKIN